MKMEFKFGDMEIKYSQNSKSSNDLRLFNDGIFSKSYFEFLNKLYEKSPLNIVNYYKNTNKIYEDYFKKLNYDKTADLKDSIPANGHDIYNYVARYDLANYQIQSVLKLDGHLDFKKLTNAVRLTIEEQPIFGCKFVENEKPYWKKLNNIDQMKFCTLEFDEHPEGAIQRFLESPLDMDKDPLVKIKLIRSAQYDTMCVKINHACCDGAGTKEYIRLLSEIYTNIDQDFSLFIPKPVERTRKEQDIFFNTLGISDPETEWIPGTEITKATWPFIWKKNISNTCCVTVCKLDQGQLDNLVRYSKAKGATINDLILAAYYRSMPDFGRPIYEEPMEISITIDLRRYLPEHKTEAIRNFSGSEFTKITLAPNESFEDTLSKVSALMREIKIERPGLQSAIGLERLEKMPFSETLSYYKMVSLWPTYCSDKCAPVLSNLGIVSDSLLTFGKRVVLEYYVVPPVVCAPGFLLMVSTYNNIVTLAGGIYEGSAKQEVIEGILNKIKYELEEGCKL